MQAFSFPELKSFLDSAGIPAHEALKVGNDFKGTFFLVIVQSSGLILNLGIKRYNLETRSIHLCSRLTNFKYSNHSQKFRDEVY